jgi:hypothetical protein
MKTTIIIWSWALILAIVISYAYSCSENTREQAKIKRIKLLQIEYYKYYWGDEPIRYNIMQTAINGMSDNRIIFSREGYGHDDGQLERLEVLLAPRDTESTLNLCEQIFTTKDRVVIGESGVGTNRVVFTKCYGDNEGAVVEYLLFSINPNIPEVEKIKTYVEDVLIQNEINPMWYEELLASIKIHQEFAE